MNEPSKSISFGSTLKRLLCYYIIDLKLIKNNVVKLSHLITSLQYTL